MANHTDFNGDGRDDILWRTDGGGAGESLGQVNGGFSEPGAGFLFAADRQVVATGDFNGDGRDDALLRSTVTGDVNVTTSLANGNGALVVDLQGYPLDFSWRVVGTGDFNGDGSDDLLLLKHNDVGDDSVTEWLGQTNDSFTWNAAATYSLPAGWHVAGTGNFNGDDKDDVLLRHDNGTLTEWLGGTGGSMAWNAAATYGLSTTWHVAGTGDFNGDQKDDVLLRHDNGTVTEWLGGTGGSMAWNAGATYALSPEWHVMRTGDFNGDQKDDVLLRHNNGTVTDWLGQDGGTFFSNHSVWTYDFFAWNTLILPVEDPGPPQNPWDY